MEVALHPEVVGRRDQPLPGLIPQRREVSMGRPRCRPGGKPGQKNCTLCKCTWYRVAVVSIREDSTAIHCTHVPGIESRLGLQGTIVHLYTERILLVSSGLGLHEE